MGERLYHAHSRRRDYEHLAKWFAEMDDLDEAHCLSAAAFGLAHPRHLAADDNLSDDMDALIWEETPHERIIEPRLRTYKRRTRANPGQYRKDEQQQVMTAYLEERKRERTLVADLLKRGRFRISELGKVDPHVRKTILRWLSRCYQNPERTTRTDTGELLKLVGDSDELTLLVAEDGTLEMPDLAFNAEGP